VKAVPNLPGKQSYLDGGTRIQHPASQGARVSADLKDASMEKVKGVEQAGTSARNLSLPCFHPHAHQFVFQSS
jgi:hypothetical protein